MDVLFDAIALPPLNTNDPPLLLSNVGELKKSILLPLEVRSYTLVVPFTYDLEFNYIYHLSF